MLTQRHKEERERELALAPLFICFSLPWPVLCKLGQAGVLFVLPEVLTLVLGVFIMLKDMWWSITRRAGFFCHSGMTSIRAVMSPPRFKRRGIKASALNGVWQGTLLKSTWNRWGFCSRVWNMQLVTLRVWPVTKFWTRGCKNWCV